MAKKSSKIEKIKLRLSSIIRRKKSFEEQWFLYGIIDKNPDLNIEELNEKIYWPLAKVNYHVKKLVKEGIVKVKENQKYYSTPFGELINWDEMKHTKRFKDLRN